jgi:preprotein translocase subunit YajC
MNMFISKAYAQVTAATPAVPTEGAAGSAAPASVTAPSATEAFLWNMGLVAVMVALFYVLLIRPQQKRFREHSLLLQGLKKGDKVITGGGLIGVIEKITEGSDEAVVDLGGGLKVTALRATLQPREAALVPANDRSAAKAGK